MYRAASQMLAGAGLEHYEISNFALPGHRWAAWSVCLCCCCRRNGCRRSQTAGTDCCVHSGMLQPWTV